MITNLEQLKLTRDALSNIEDAMHSLKLKVFEKNPNLYYSMAQDYLENIEEMRREIDEFLGLTILMEYKAPLWIRLAGNYINIWNTPLSVWSSVLYNIRSSVASVAKILRNTKDIPDNSINFFSDFEVSGIGDGSLKIGFNMHTKGEYELFPKSSESDAMKLVEEALTKILETSNWFAKGKEIEELDSLFESKSIRDFVISKTINLMPSPRSKYNVIEFSGSILPVETPIKLYSKSRKRIKEFIIKNEDEIEQECIGVIREIDLDKKHFILRQREESTVDLQCKFSEDNFNQIKDLLDTKVKIIGVIKKGKSSPLYLKFVENVEDSK